jgi:hypothetical protein
VAALPTKPLHLRLFSRQEVRDEIRHISNRCLTDRHAVKSTCAEPTPPARCRVRRPLGKRSVTARGFRRASGCPEFVPTQLLGNRAQAAPSSLCRQPSRRRARSDPLMTFDGSRRQGSPIRMPVWASSRMISWCRSVAPRAQGAESPDGLRTRCRAGDSRKRRLPIDRSRLRRSASLQRHPKGRADLIPHRRVTRNCLRPRPGSGQALKGSERNSFDVE